MANKDLARDSFVALADPTRRTIFERLAEHPSAVGDLARTLPAVSQHLRVLKEAGLVTDSAEGTSRIYRLDPRGIAAMRAWLDLHWAAALTAFANYADEPAPTEKETPK